MNKQTCKFSECDNKVRIGGYCTRHYKEEADAGTVNAKRCKCGRWAIVGPNCEACYNRLRRKGDFGYEICVGPECEKPGTLALGLCSAHYKQKLKGWELRPLRFQRDASEWSEWTLTNQGYLIRERRQGAKVLRQLQHRFIMEEKLGRPLSDKETVHHRNGIRDDNRVENLELWSGRHPKGARVEDQLDWAIEILSLYRPELLVN